MNGELYVDYPLDTVKAACTTTDPDLFFPESGRHDQSREARKICAGCDIMEDCLKYSLDKEEEFGVWGGAGQRERLRMLANPALVLSHVITMQDLKARMIAKEKARG